jgi:transcriptional regulator of heat shock response
MVKFVDNREREQEIFDLILESYIQESKPISSAYLCNKYRLPYSPATVRNIMLELEKKGLLSHLHTSSGRVPTRKGFKYYVGHLDYEDMINGYPVSLNLTPSSLEDIQEVINYTLDTLAEVSGYTSLVAISGSSSEDGLEERLYFRGARFILDQPEFEDIRRLRNLFYALEVKMNQLQDLLFHYIDEKVKILIGDEIGFEEIADCSLVVSGSREQRLSFALALLGPMRMDYIRAASCIYKVQNELKKIIEEL